MSLRSLSRRLSSRLSSIRFRLNPHETYGEAISRITGAGEYASESMLTMADAAANMRAAMTYMQSVYGSSMQIRLHTGGIVTGSISGGAGYTSGSNGLGPAGGGGGGASSFTPGGGAGGVCAPGGSGGAGGSGGGAGGNFGCGCTLCANRYPGGPVVSGGGGYSSVSGPFVAAHSPTPGMDGFGERGEEDFAAGKITGYRWWRLPVPDSRRSPLDADVNWPPSLLSGQCAEWQPGVNEAVCQAGPGAHEEEIPAAVCGCVSPETRVLTADLRWVPAGDLAVGEHLMAFDEHSSGPSAGRKYRDAVVACVDRGPLPCYDLAFEDGSTVRVSSDHQWLCYSGDKAARWVRTDELRAGDLRASHVVKPYDPWEEDLSKEAGYLAAGFDGEGCLSQHPARFQNRVGFVQVSNPMLAEMKRCLKVLGFDYNYGVHVRGPHEHTRTDGSPRSDTHTLTIDRKPELLRFLGTVRPLRLLDRFQPDLLGRVTMERRMRLVSKKFAGEQEVVKLGTTTGTYVAEGYLSHNCGYWGYWNPSHYNLGGSSGRTMAVSGVIEGWGRTRVGELGFRSAKARILALHLPFTIYAYMSSPGGWYDPFTLSIPHEELTLADADRLEAWMAAIETRLEETYPGVTVFTDAKAMLAKFPLTPGYGC